MSTKKQIRQKRQAKQEEKPRRKLNPALVVILFIAALLAFGAVALLVHDPEPPEPGMVWSPEHGHWH